MDREVRVRRRPSPQSGRRGLRFLSLLAYSLGAVATLAAFVVWVAYCLLTHEYPYEGPVDHALVREGRTTICLGGAAAILLWVLVAAVAARAKGWRNGAAAAGVVGAVGVVLLTLATWRET